MRAALVAIVLTGCSSGLSLTVDLRTDLAPVTEITGVRTMLDGAEIDHVPRLGEAWLSGARVAEFTPVTPGAHVVVVSLYSGARLVARRDVALTIATSYAVTVVITHSCASITCPQAGDPASATTCVNGACASPSCGTTGAPPCPMCTSDASCPPPRATCATAMCSTGACLDAPHDDRCSSGQICDVALGCVIGTPHADGGTGDGGPPRDGGGGHDGGHDAGPPPCVPDCSGRVCGADPTCGESCGPDCSAGATCSSAGTCVCGAGRTYCGASCVDTATDAANCGGCGRSCSGGTCTGGSCLCPSGLTACARGCVDLSMDSGACGSCDVQCNILSGPACCSGTCTFLPVDAANCGMCGHTCLAGQTCLGAMCM